MWFTESGKPPLPGSRTVCGYALQWGVPSAVRPGFDEVFHQGSLTWPEDLPLCRNHMRTEPLVRLGNAFRLRATSTGLWVEVDTDMIPDGDDLLLAARHGPLRAWSISFKASDERWDRTGHRPLRIVTAARLLEVSICDRGAHQTTIGILSRIKQAA
ncbi:HK97 family phage prohead protease [Mesorhizobium sp. M1365]|uniref:HK97 family phage prohead protease n=1 Tax=Mesorhizobium sp. M1365 TaxID=2957090 RepID=UPI003337D240